MYDHACAWLVTHAESDSRSHQTVFPPGIQETGSLVVGKIVHVEVEVTHDDLSPVRTFLSTILIDVSSCLAMWGTFAGCLGTCG